MLTGRRTYPRLLVRGLVLFGVGMTIFAAVVSRERHSTANARNEVLSQYVALEARTLAPSDPALASQLALVAYRLRSSEEARSALIDTGAGEIPTRLVGNPGETELALGDDGHRLAIAYQSAGAVKIYSLRYSQLTLLATVTAGSRAGLVDSVAMSHSGRLLAVGDSNGQVTLWSLASPAHPRQLASLRAGPGAVHGLSFSPAGAALAAADADGSVQRWSLADAHPVAAAPLIAPGKVALLAVSYSHTGESLTAAGRDGTLVIWPAHGRSRPLAVVAAGSATLTAVTYSPNGRWLAAGGKDGLTRVWRINGQGRPSAATASMAGSGAITSVAFSRDSRFLAVSAASRVARVASTSDWNQVSSLPHPAGVTSVVFGNRDRRLLSSDVAGSTLVWQFPSPSSYTVRSSVTGLSFSLTKPELAVRTASGAPQQWDVVSEWRPSPVGAWNATPLSAPPTTKYWLLEETLSTTTTPSTTTTSTTTTTTVNPAAGDDALQRTRALTKVTTSLLSPNGQLFVAAGEDGVIYLWNVSVTDAPELVNKLTGPATTVTQLAISPDGRQLAVATATGHVWLFSVARAAKASLRATLTAASGKLMALAFSPSDDTLVAGGEEGRLTFWHYRPYQAANRVCALAGTPITPSEWAKYVPEASYSPPCAKWTPPAPPQLRRTSG